MLNNSSLLLNRVAYLTAIAGMGIFLQVMAGYWDVLSHRIQFEVSDPWWNPAHIILYSAFLAVFACLSSVMKLVRGRGVSSAAFPALRFAFLAALVELLSGIWNEVHHTFISPEEPPYFSPHELVAITVIMTNAGMVRLLGAVRSVIRNRSAKSMVNVSIFLLMTSMWTLIAGIAMYMGDAIASASSFLVASIVLAFLPPFIWLAAWSIYERVGVVTSIGLLYMGINYLFLVGYGAINHLEIFGEDPMLLISFTTSLGADIILYSLKKTRVLKALIVGTATGPLFMITYYPYTPFIASIDLNPAMQSLLLLTLIAGVVGSMVGLKVGQRVVMRGSELTGKLAGHASW